MREVLRLTLVFKSFVALINKRLGVRMRGAGAGASSAATAVSIGPTRRVVLSDGTVQRRKMIGGLAGAKKRMAEPLREFFSADYDSALVQTKSDTDNLLATVGPLDIFASACHRRAG